MKTTKITTLIYFILFGFNYVSAQSGYGNNNYGNNGMNGGGMNRNQQSMQNSNNYSRNEKSPETIEKERIENISKFVDKFTKDLELDDLQVIVIRKEIESSSTKIRKAIKSEISEDDKIKEVQAINEEMDLTILTFLNNTQKIKYKKIVEERNLKIDNYRNNR